MQVKMLTVATILQYISTKKKMEDLNRWVHTLPIIRGYVSDDAFFNRTGLERIRVVGPNLDCWRAGP